MKTKTLAQLHFEYVQKDGKSEFDCIVEGCGKIYYMLGPHLDNHYYTEHYKKNVKGGETTMNPWTYEEAELTLKGAFQGKTDSQIALGLKGRSVGAVRSFLNNFRTWTGDNKAVYISNVLKNYFARYVNEHPREVPEQRIQDDVEEVKESEDQGVTETTKEEVKSSDTTFADLKNWYEQGGPFIMAHVKAEVAKKVAEEVAAKNQEIEELERKLGIATEEANAYKEKADAYDAAARLFSK